MYYLLIDKIIIDAFSRRIMNYPIETLAGNKGDFKFIQLEEKQMSN